MTPPSAIELGLRSSRPQATIEARGLEFYKRSDSRSFCRLLGYLQQRGLHVDGSFNDLYAVVPAIHHLSWTPTELSTPLITGEDGPAIDAMQLMHQAIHHAMASYANVPVSGHPRTTAALEGIACATDTYFELAKLAEGFVQPRKFYLDQFRRNYVSRHGSAEGFASFIRDHVEHPFATFRRVARFVARLTLFLFENKDALQRYDAETLESAHALICADPVSVFALHYNYGAFVYYLRSECASADVASDTWGAWRIEEALSRAGDMSSFLDVVIADQGTRLTP